MNDYKILIIDDVATVRDTIINNFRVYGKPNNFEFPYAKNTKEALKLINNDKFDVIFLDIQIPGDGGFSILEKIYKNFPKEISKVYVLTAFALSDEDKEKAKEFDVPYERYLIKFPSPFKKKVKEIIKNIKKS